MPWAAGFDIEIDKYMKGIISNRLLVLSILSLLLVGTTDARQKEKRKKPLFGWNGTLGIGPGYAKQYKTFSSTYYGMHPTAHMFGVDFSLLGVYCAIYGGDYKTGYKVYGYDEKIQTLAWKVGPSFRIGQTDGWRLVLSPYVGQDMYKVRDTSNNAIGARGDYGTHEKYVIYGLKLAVAYKWGSLGGFFSNREGGISLMLDMDPFRD